MTLFLLLLLLLPLKISIKISRKQMISSLVQGYGSEDEESESDKDKKDDKEKKTHREKEEEEDDISRERRRRQRQRPLSVPSTFESSRRRNNNKKKKNEEINTEIQARVEKYLEAKRTTRLNINSQLREPKGFRNPNFLQSVVEHFGVEQDGSELPGRREQKKQEEEEDSYEKIAARQRAEAEDRIRNRTNISFVQQNEESFGGPDAQELIDKAREQARMLNARMAAKGQR
jgi:hypothetical protein